MQKLVMIVLLAIAATPVFAQCEVMSRIGADEVLYYHLGYVPFYLTSSKTLYGEPSRMSRIIFLR
jgi:hypothetical protein